MIMKNEIICLELSSDRPANAEQSGLRSQFPVPSNEWLD
jgi:hypothetical protein